LAIVVETDPDDADESRRVADEPAVARVPGLARDGDSFNIPRAARAVPSS
jgi:hypothetical protein